jgi:hypothetical protein
VQFQFKLCQPVSEIVEEALSVRLVLEADDRIVRVADNNHVPMGTAFPPLLHP